ncbi:MAG: CBS domain-containing protein [Gammaproteobacteria bacterium]|nr:CBS domain-containing protein [Gammaproteobacteria bacterium]MDH5650504.1 CBS domain-containing protein [Gammaproteobacteria bacterium]
MIKSCRVKDFMQTNLVTINAEMEMMEAVRIMVEHGVSGVPVVDEQNNLIGIITEKDCMNIVLNASYYNEWGGSVKEFMSTEVESVDDNMSLTDISEKFIRGPYRRFPVADNGRLVGQVSRHDVLKVLLSLAE